MPAPSRRTETESPTSMYHAEDHWTTVSRTSFVAHDARRAENMSPARREHEKVKERLATGPKFAAATNYDLSFHGEPAKRAPSCKPPPQAVVLKPFTETSTSRASFTGAAGEAPSVSRARARSPAQHAPAPFHGTTISRQSYVQHCVKPPVRRHEEHRRLPKTKFDAVSTSAASFAAPGAASQGGAP
eukprot:CAMPEP_0174831654 /NCGR_PEP_ID=MMETSP1114-20130205/3221_1 /TAXON_ID=312471 /ORGANISM="Neobodo designis, Strain CCAP 1951/1" /LENGTH=186 /DNA_ID=CAMNT_0016065485 /DNA_START=50 /DNA_END=610 /DNA_ORIENTATION=+